MASWLINSTLARLGVPAHHPDGDYTRGADIGDAGAGWENGSRRGAGRRVGDDMTSDRPVAPLLTVKQVIPRVRDGAVGRDRLNERLTSATSRLTVVVAPAGWGKTVLLSSWAASLGPDAKVAWLSLDEEDDEPVRFWRYLIGALRTASDGVSAAVLEALMAPGLRPLDLAVPMLLNELAAASAPHVLVLDDFHMINSSQLHEEVEYFVSYLPPTLRLLVASRQDPPLPLARLRVRGELTEVRAEDLRFDQAESTAMLTALAGPDLAESDMVAARRRTEGWAAGLQLAGLALRSRPDGTRHAELVDDERNMIDYFAAEVMPELTAEQYDLLVRAAPLDRLSGPLCDAALGMTDSGAVLDQLDRQSLFVVALDRRREWYRCHHLFREALLREAVLGAGREDAETHQVLRRAADWFVDQDLLDEAAHYLLRAGDDAAAARLLESSESWFFERGLAATYLAFGDALPNSTVTPQLALVMAYAAEACGRRDGIPHWLDSCDHLITPSTSVRGWSSARAGALMMRGLIGTSEAETDRSVKLTRQAVELERAAGDRDPQTALLALGAALARDGQFGEAAEILQDAWRSRGRADWSTGVHLQTAGLLGIALNQLSRSAELDELLREARPLADQAEQNWGPAAGPLVALLRVVEGRQLYQRGEVAHAREVLAHAVQVPARALTQVLGLIFLADAEIGCGDRRAARAALSQAREVVANEPVPPYAVAALEQAETRLGRRAVHAAARSGALMEELTDRELAILRTLPGSATQREIGAALYLSLNTIKAYNKNLYRKLGVNSRQDAVAVARQLGLI
jgi:LuxR family maltose regulon positive regulatory protein